LDLLNKRRNKKMKIVNGTNHKVVIYSVVGLIQHPERRGAWLISNNAEILKVIPEGQNLNAQKGESEILTLGNIPCQTVAPFEQVDPIPEGDIVIVSQMYRAACKELGLNTSNLATVSGPVFEEGNPRPIGVTSLEVG
jgi:hypothetical protein